MSQPSPDSVTSEEKAMAESAMPLAEHLSELRTRLLKSLAVLFGTFLVAFYFAGEILSFLVHPLPQAEQEKIIFTHPLEAFLVHVKVSFFVACLVAFPFLANQLWQFVAPGLYQRERRVFLPFLIATPILFLSGASFAYFIIISTALDFLLSFQGDLGGVNLEALLSASNYLSFTLQIILAFGIAFLLPVLLMLLERGGIVTYAQLNAARRYMIVAAFAIAAVLTPPDALSQILLAVPLVLLYEVSLFAIRVTHRRSAVSSTEEKSGDSDSNQAAEHRQPEKK